MILWSSRAANSGKPICGCLLSDCDSGGGHVNAAVMLQHQCARSCGHLWRRVCGMDENRTKRLLSQRPIGDFRVLNLALKAPNWCVKQRLAPSNKTRQRYEPWLTSRTEPESEFHDLLVRGTPWSSSTLADFSSWMILARIFCAHPRNGQKGGIRHLVSGTHI